MAALSVDSRPLVYLIINGFIFLSAPRPPSSESDDAVPILPLLLYRESWEETRKMMGAVGIWEYEGLTKATLQPSLILVMLPLYYEGHTKRAASVSSVFFIMEAQKVMETCTHPEPVMAAAFVSVRGADIFSVALIKLVTLTLRWEFNHWFVHFWCTTCWLGSVSLTTGFWVWVNVCAFSF